MSRAPALLLAAAVGASAACRGGEREGEETVRRAEAMPAAVAAAAATPAAASPSLDEALRRFRTGLAPVATLEGGADSREALIRALLAALTRSDTATLRGLALGRAEFAYLVYPSSPYTRAPYRQPPELVWGLLQAGSEKGLARLLERGAGRELHYVDHRCAPAAEREGENQLWRGCTVRVAGGADTASARLFGVIVEREGRFKLASFDNDF